MPASRARGTHWRKTLAQVCERDGAIELALAPPEGGEGPSRGDLVWRVRLLRVGDDEMLVETPRALGRDVPIATGTELVGAIVIGQNRWTFRARVLAAFVPHRAPQGGTLAIEMPDHLERCQRRHGRYDATGLQLPTVDLWSLLDPSSVVPMQRAAMPLIEHALAGHPIDASVLDEYQPVVGPRFSATLMNIGGGGVGVRLEPADAVILAHHPVLWVRIPLGDAMPVPLLATGKVVHTHLDSAQFTYAGLAFDFSFNPAAQRLITEQILFTIEAQQRRQPLRAA